MKTGRAKIGLLCSKNDNKLSVSEDILKAIWTAGGVGIALPYLKSQSTDGSERTAYTSNIDGASPYSISRNADKTTCIAKTDRNSEAFSSGDKAPKPAYVLDITDEVFGGAERAFDSADKALGGASEALGGTDEALGGASEALGGTDEAFGGASEALGGTDEALGGADEALGGADEALGGAERAFDSADKALGGTSEALSGAREVALVDAGSMFRNTDRSFSATDAALGNIDTILDYFDGFLFCGGGDIHPKYYAENCCFDVSNTSSERDEFEDLVFNKVYFSNKPILGICRGMQVINVFLGGSLYQNIEGHSQCLPRDKTSHFVTLNDRGFLVSVVNSKKIHVNSFHHQSVKKLGRGLICDATSDDRYIEAFFSSEHRFCVGLQWHPECCFYNDEPSRKIFKAFITACVKQN